MGWAENRIRDYRRGEAASWLERRMLEHANPVHFPLALAASIGFVYGLWRHRWPWILGASALALAGHVYCWTRPDERAPRELGSPEDDTSVVPVGRAVAPGPGPRPSAEGAGLR